MGNHKKYILITLFMTLAFSAFRPDAAQAGDGYGRQISATKERLFHAARKILILQGFELETVDAHAGTVSTAGSPLRLSSSDCECGVTLDPAEDIRPIINVAVDIQADDNRLLIRPRLFGDYPKAQISERMIADDLFDQIARYLE